MLFPSIISRFISRIPEKEIRRILENPLKILLVKQAERLGNIVLLNGAISALKTGFPGAEIDLLLPAKFSGIMDDDERINRVIPVHKKVYISRPWKLFALLSGLRETGYDIAIDCSDVNSRSSTGAAYTLLCGARVTAGWQGGGFFSLNIPRYSDVVHATEMYLRLVSEVFGRRLDGLPYFRMASGGSVLANPLVGINCGGRDEKKWPLENFVLLGRLLSQKNIQSEFILGPDEEQLRYRLNASLPNGCRLLPPMPVSALKKTFNRYAVFVSSDSGPMHVAWSLDIPVIAIFLSSETEKFRPLSDGSVAIDATQGLNPERVFDLVNEALTSRRIAV